MDGISLVLLLISGFVAGIFGTTTGAAGTITVPSLIILGLSPTAALATNKLAMVATFSTGLLKFYKDSKLPRRQLLLPLLIPFSIASFIGSNLLLFIDNEITKIMIIVFSIFILILTITKKQIEQSLKRFHTKGLLLGAILTFLAGLYQGLIGVGFGTFYIFILVFLLGMTFLEGTKLMTIINLAGVIISTSVFVVSNVINYVYAIPLLVSLGIGGWVGAHLAIHKGNEWLEKMFIVAVLLLIGRLIFL